MRKVTMLMAALVLASSASAQAYPNEAPSAHRDTAQVAQQDGTKTIRQVSLLKIQNETMSTISVYDQATLVARVMSGETKMVLLAGRGSRPLTVRGFGLPETKTEPYTFESNRSWSLRIDYYGKVWLDLGT